MIALVSSSPAWVYYPSWQMDQNPADLSDCLMSGNHSIGSEWVSASAICGNWPAITILGDCCDLPVNLSWAISRTEPTLPYCPVMRLVKWWCFEACFMLWFCIFLFIFGVLYVCTVVFSFFYGGLCQAEKAEEQAEWMDPDPLQVEVCLVARHCWHPSSWHCFDVRSLMVIPDEDREETE